MFKWFLNAYLDNCLDIISCMDEFDIYHVPREENPRANALAQQASGYNVRKKSRTQTVACSRVMLWRHRSGRRSRPV
jgi:hypothetical protein